MQQGPSRTAISSARHRAAHLLLDEPPHVLVDRFARGFAGDDSDDALLRVYQTLKLPQLPRIRALFPVRSRYAEDELAAALSRGIRQYVILGAGLDSFAYRNPDLMASLEVFEVDHPASQNWKRSRIAELGIATPTRLHHVPVDFEQDTLMESLVRSGIDLAVPIFFSLLGVTEYLTRDALVDSLRSIAALGAPGSELVVQFVVPPDTLSHDEAVLTQALATRAAGFGEPWLTLFRPEEFLALLHEVGFGATSLFSSAQANARYLAGRTDGLRVPAYFHLVTARIG